MKKTNNAPIIIAAVALVLIGLAWNEMGAMLKSKDTARAADPDALPGMRTSRPPWEPELARLLDRLHIIGFPALPDPGTALRLRQHLDIYVNGESVVIPAGIGVHTAAGFMAPVHTRDTSGVIHIASDRIRDFNLGELFDVWGVRFDGRCIGSYCADKEHSLFVYVNGNPVMGDPRKALLEANQEIVIVYGESAKAPPIPTDYSFGPDI
ncbi:MAG: hypothetical protein AAB923_03405 [Patescibacteria group bacterium]